MKSTPALGRAAACLGALCGALAGCAGSPPSGGGPQAGLSCVDDSVDCINKRKQTLDTLVEDQKRDWIREPATAESYASGVRLFAYKKKKKDLSCEELAIGRKEAEGAPAALKNAGTLLTPAQVSRGRMLAVEISRELAAELGRRCKKA